MKILEKNIPNFYDHRKYLCLVIFAVILAAISLSPMLASGYFSDDSRLSLTNGDLLIANQTVPEMTLSGMVAWMHNEGRFFPLAWYLYLFFSIIDNLFLYKISILIFVIINIIVFAYFIEIVTNSPSIAFFSILLPPLFFQFRLYHDPILSFYWLQQIVFLYTFISLIFLVYYLQTGKRYFLMLSSFSYLLSLLTYEITYPFFLLHFFIIYYYLDNKRALNVLKVLSPFILVLFVTVLISTSLRIYYNIPFSGGNSPYVPNFDIRLYFITLMKQTYAAFPLSFYIIDPHKIFPNSFNYMINSFSIWYIILGTGYFILFFYALNNLDVKSSSIKSVKGILFLGILLLFLPSVLMSLSPKFQDQLNWGIGYLPVYHSHFGLVMMFIAFAYLAYNKISNIKLKLILSILIAIILSSIVLINYNNNNISIEHENSLWLYPRTILEDATKNGLFMGVPNESYLLIDSNNQWDKLAFFRMHSNVKLKNLGIKGKYPVDNLPQDALIQKSLSIYNIYDFSKYNNIFFLSYDSFSNENGYALLGRIKDLHASKEKISEVNSREIYLYVRTPYFSPLNSHERITVHGQWIKKKSSSYEPFVMEESQMNLVTSGLNWKLYSILINNGNLIDLQSLNVNIVAATTISSEHWRAKNESELTFNNTDKEVLLHAGFKNGIISNGILLEPLYLSKNFTIEVIAKPSMNQVNYAAIIGNHPGYNNYEGFIIQHDKKNSNMYTFGFGNGKEWLPGVKFKLNEEKWNYLAIVIDEYTIRIYVNGILVTSNDSSGSMKNSDMPLYIGNWIGEDRPFNGLIEEVRILNCSISETEIVSEMQEIQEKLDHY